MCQMRKSSWWCHKLFVIPIIVATFLGLVTALNMDYKSRTLPSIIEDTYTSNVNFMLNEYKVSDKSLEDYLIQTVTLLDNNNGVAAGLYTLDKQEIYPLNKSSDGEKCHFSEGKLKEKVINSISSENKVIEFNMKTLQYPLTYKFHYFIRDNYVVIYSIRPDYISKYGLNFDSFYWWILGGMLFNIFTYIITFSIFRRYQVFYDKRVDNYNQRRKYIKDNRVN